MVDALKTLFKQPYWVISLILGTFLVAFPYVDIDKDNHFKTHPPINVVPIVIGIVLLVVSILGFAVTFWKKHKTDELVGTGLDLTKVKEKDGVMWTTVGGCEIRAVNGRLQDYPLDPGSAIVLPCNEYFDDQCAGDTKSALGAYVNRAFEGQVGAFVALVKDECKKKLSPITIEQKTDDERAESFGPGRCVLLLKPLGRSVSVALVSTTTQRAGRGLAARISYLFDGMSE